MNGIHRMGEAIKEQEKDSETTAFSVRLPTKLVEQIDARRKIAKRSRNMEVALLLERQIEAEVKRDLDLVEKMSRLNLNPQSNQT